MPAVFAQRLRNSCSCRNDTHDVDRSRPRPPKRPKAPLVRHQAASAPAAVSCRGGRGTLLRTRVAAGSVPAPQPDAGGGSGGGGGGASAADAVYIRAPLAPGASLHYPQSSVVVLGDVPAGARVEAGGDVIVLGTLSGAAAAGCGGDASSIVLVGRLSPSAQPSVAGWRAATAPSRDSNLVLAVPAGAAEATWAAMPGSPQLAPAAPEGVASKLLRGAIALAVLAFGLGLLLAPAQLLGTLLSTNAESVAGALLDCLVFGYIILQGANLLSEGSELLLEILNPGIVGGVVLPVLGALPDSLIILTSLTASRAEAQEQVAVGIGTLAGSSVLLLSLAWGLSVLVGRCDLGPSGSAIDRQLTRGWDLDATGVTVDADVRNGAAIMMASVLLYGCVQVPASLGFSNSPQAALTGAVACLTGMVAYCAYSVLSPQLQQRRIDAARRRRFRFVAVKALALRSSEKYGSLVDRSGRLRPDMVRSIFDEFDADGSGCIDTREVQGLLVGLQLAGGVGSMGGAAAGGRGGGAAAAAVDAATVEYWMKEFDANADSRITFDEFESALGRWVDEKLAASSAAASSMAASVDGGGGGAPGASAASAPRGFAGTYLGLVDPSSSLLADLPADDLAALKETAAELENESPDEAAEDLGAEEGGGAALSARDILVRAVLRMGAGIALCAVFSDPLVEALTNLSRATGIAPFVLGFVLTPLASNSSEFVSSLNFAARKRRRNMSLTLSQVYGAVTMNNTLVLGLFLMVVYVQRLEWVYSSEVTVIAACTMIIGALGWSRSTFQSRYALYAIALYPLSLLGVFALDTLLGWQ